MKKTLLAILVILLLSAGVIVGLILVGQQQIFKQKASSPTGQATVSIKPATATVQRNSPQTVSIYFNTAQLSISGVSARLTFSNLSAGASNIQINSTLLSSGDWSCPVKNITAVGSTTQVDISCVNTNAAGYSNSADTLLGSFDLTATQVPLQNPLIVSFDPTESRMTQKSDSADILLTPSSTGSYTITDTVASSPTPTPIVIVATPTSAPSGTYIATSTPTPTPTATTVAVVGTSTPIPTATTPASTPFPVPVTGFDTPTIIGAVGGIVLILFAGAILIL